MKNAVVIENAKVVLENGIIWDGVIVIKDGKIFDFGKNGEVEIPEGAEIVDACGAYVGPGFVDIHVHGGNGYSTCYETEKAGEFFLQHGTTSFLATPDSHMNLDTLLTAIRNIKSAYGKVPNLKGIYMEAPYTNPDKGSHSYDNPWRQGIFEEEYKQFVDEAGSLARVWTVAPEREGIYEFVKYVKTVNPDAVIAVGHTTALPHQIRALGKYRPTLQTHSMNASGNYGKNNGLREVGSDEYCFKENDLYTELISDSLGIHVNCEMQQLLVHLKGIDRVVLITDSTVHHNPVPEQFAGVTDLNFDARGGLAGSKLTMDVAARNIMTHTNCGIAQAFIMASTNPAKAIGMYDDIGSIEKGKVADLVFVDDIFNVKRVMLGGELCKF